MPGAFFIYKGERYKILKAKVGNGIGKPGEVVSDYLEIACGDKQSIIIKEIQRQGCRDSKSNCQGRKIRENRTGSNSHWEESKRT